MLSEDGAILRDHQALIIFFVELLRRIIRMKCLFKKRSKENVGIEELSMKKIMLIRISLSFYVDNSKRTKKSLVKEQLVNE